MIRQLLLLERGFPHTRGSNIGLAGCGMRVKMEAGCGMTEVLLVGCGIKILRRERDLLILTGEMRNSFKIDGGMRDEKEKITRYGCYARNCNSTRRDRDKHSE